MIGYVGGATPVLFKRHARLRRHLQELIQKRLGCELGRRDRLAAPRRVVVVPGQDVQRDRQLCQLGEKLDSPRLLSVARMAACCEPGFGHIRADQVWGFSGALPAAVLAV